MLASSSQRTWTEYEPAITRHRLADARCTFPGQTSRGAYIPRRANAYGTVRTRILTSAQSDHPAILGSSRIPLGEMVKLDRQAEAAQAEHA